MTNCAPAAIGAAPRRLRARTVAGMRLDLGPRLAAAIAAVMLGHTPLSVGTAAGLETPESQPGVGLGRGVALIRCRSEADGAWRISRGALLDLDLRDTDRDIVLATAHGLPTALEAVQRDCRVLGTRGRQYRIEDARRSTTDDSDLVRDWAVLLIGRRLEGEVSRLRLGQVTPEGLAELVTAEAPLRLVLRYADLRQGDCRLARPEEDRPERGLTSLMFYSCRGAPGLSGSPILIGVDGHATLIGIHLGWTFVPMAGARPRPLSVGRAIDAEIVAATLDAIARAQATDGRRRGARQGRCSAPTGCAAR